MNINSILDYIHKNLNQKEVVQLCMAVYVVKLETLAMLANCALKLDNPINAFLINLNIILHHIMFFH